MTKQRFVPRYLPAMILLALIPSGCLMPQIGTEVMEPTSLPELNTIAVPRVPAEGTVYLGTKAGAFELVEGEPIQVRAITRDSLDCRSLLVLPGEPRRILVGTMFEGLFLTTESTPDRWEEQFLQSFEGRSIDAIRLAADQERFFISTGARIWVGELRDMSFRPIWNPEEGDFIKHLFIDPADPDAVKIHTLKGQHHVSRDGGETWDERPGREYLHSQRVTRKGISVSTLTDQEKELPLNVMVAVVTDSVGSWSVNPSDTQHVLITGYDSGLFSVRREGSRWSSERVYPGPDSKQARDQVVEVRFAPGSPGTAYTATKSTLLRSDDSGKTWKALW